jgi:hypothetical protein
MRTGSEQHGRRNFDDDGETPLGPNPEASDLPPLRLLWGTQPSFYARRRAHGSLWDALLLCAMSGSPGAGQPGRCGGRCRRAAPFGVARTMLESGQGW